jgi:hypothetical protein
MHDKAVTYRYLSICFKMWQNSNISECSSLLGNDQLDALFFNVFIYASTCFEQQVLIIRRAKLY